jgi:ribosomal protein L37AE/L43A
MEKLIKKNCYYCHLDKDTAEMQQIVVWFCNDCLEKSKGSNKKKKE